MAGKVIVACKLPHGIVLRHPDDPSKNVVLNGLNKATVIGAHHATTEVDEDFWNAWKAKHSSFQPLTSGAIYVAKTSADVAAMGKEMAGEKTGLEPMPQEAHGVKKDDGK